MTAVHLQLREDAELGAAWRRCEAIEETVSLRRHSFGDYIASDDVLAYWGRTPAEALNALADALEARRAAE